MDKKLVDICKHSGANYIARTYALSDLGVKVANVLGQVGLGIYHYARDLDGKNKPKWNAKDLITVVLHGEMATFDGSELTRLILCCQQAGLCVEMAGRTGNCMALHFTDGVIDLPEDALTEESSISDFVYLQQLDRYTKKLDAQGRFLWKRERDRFYSENGEIKSLCLSLANNSIDLPALVYHAHQACIRVGISGLTHQSVRVWLSKRSGRSGAFWDRHPNWDEHRALLEHLWAIDFESLG